LALQDEIGYSQTKLFKRIWKYRAFYLMIAPLLTYYLLFHYLPMVGIRIAFFDFGLFGIKQTPGYLFGIPIKGFIGLQNFRDLFADSYFWVAFKNTLVISLGNLFLGMVSSLLIALLLNELTSKFLRKTVQTAVYLPHFLSWIVVGSIFTLMLSPADGVVNAVIKAWGGNSIHFLAQEAWWQPIFLLIYRWKETGWGAIVFLAALSNIDLDLYEAAWMDGASRLRQVWHVTLPSIRSTILVVFILQFSTIMNIFESALALQNPLVYSVSDVLGTYVYRVGMGQGNYDYATAVGLFQSVVALILVLMANNLSQRIQGERIL